MSIGLQVGGSNPADIRAQILAEQADKTIDRDDSLRGVAPSATEYEAPPTPATALIVLDDGTQEIWEYDGTTWTLDTTIDPTVSAEWQDSTAATAASNADRITFKPGHIIDLTGLTAGQYIIERIIDDHSGGAGGYEVGTGLLVGVTDFGFGTYEVIAEGGGVYRRAVYSGTVNISGGGTGTPLTAAQIKTLNESNADTNAFTDADEAKLDGLTNETPATIKSAYESNTDTNAFTDAEQTKLAALMAETPVSIKTAYESNPDTNAFTDALMTKLDDLTASVVDLAALVTL